MRYHYKAPSVTTSMYGELYECDHPVYSRCTLFRIRDRGLAVVQQRFNKRTKSVAWTEIDWALTDDIYLNENFYEYFDKMSDIPDEHGLYPTVTVRQIMWHLRMKPLKRERWETVFDRPQL